MDSSPESDAQPVYIWGPKGMLVALYGFIGAYAATVPCTGLAFHDFPAALVPRLEIPAWMLLGAVLWQGSQLSRQGKASASWAVIAYGSLCVALIKYLVAAVWYVSDDLKNQWLMYLICAGIACTVIVLGLWCAFRALWGLMFGVSLFALLELFVLGFALNYAQHDYCRRHHLLTKHRPALESVSAPSTLPAVPKVKREKP